jgi:peptide/nickel transport system substrate-binding protein
MRRTLFSPSPLSPTENQFAVGSFAQLRPQNACSQFTYKQISNAPRTIELARKLTLGLFIFVCAIQLVACGGSSNKDKDATDGSTKTKGPSKLNETAVKEYKISHPRLALSSGSNGAAAAGDDTKYVTIATADKAQSLDPHNTSSGGDVKVMLQIYETLVVMDPKDASIMVPELAKSWQVADDGLSITFEIRKGITFHDGAKLDAQAVKQSLDRLIGKAYDTTIAPYRDMFLFITEITASDMSVTVKLNAPVARVALRNLSMFPASVISPKLLEVTDKVVADVDAAKKASVRTLFISQWASGTGPFALSKFNDAEGKVRLRAFDNYRKGKPAISRLVFQNVADSNSQLEYLKSGGAHMLDDPPRPVWDELEEDPAFNLHRWWALNVCYLGVNVGHETTKDTRVRQAIRLAIDRGDIAKLYFGGARPTYSLVAQPIAEYDPTYRAPGIEQPLSQRQADAKRLLMEADAAGRKMRIFYPNLPRPYLPTPEKAADKIRQQLNAIGLEVEIVGVPNSELFNSLSKDEYELVLIGWMSDNADPDNFYMPLGSGNPKTGKPSSMNAGRTFDADLHKQMQAAQAITDKDKRIAAYRAIERYMQEKQVGHIPLLNTQQAIVTSAKLQGVVIDPLGHYRFDKAELK